VLEIDEGIGRPELSADFLASDHLPGATQQHFKDEVRLTPKFYLCPALGELTRTRVHFERAESVFFPRPQRIPANTTLLRDFITAGPMGTCNKMTGADLSFCIPSVRTSRSGPAKSRTTPDIS
jgi:hypothetical protein